MKNGHDLLVPVPGDEYAGTGAQSYRLSAYAISILKPIFDKYDFDLSQITVYKVDVLGDHNIGWTIGNTVNVDVDYWSESNNYGRLDLLAHEITHSVQYRELGTASFFGALYTRAKELDRQH